MGVLVLDRGLFGCGFVRCAWVGGEASLKKIAAKIAVKRVIDE